MNKSDFDGVEVAWPTTTPSARLVWDWWGVVGRLEFISPKTGRKVDVIVTTGDDQWLDQITIKLGEHAWHIDLDGSDAVVRPSIHFVGHFHSPNPVSFKLVVGELTIPSSSL